VSRSGRLDFELMAYDPQTSAACPRTSPDVQLSLKIRILHLGVFRWTYSMVVKMVVRPIAKLSKRLAQGQLVHRHGRIMSSTIAVLAFR
jgi:hypothetical protein